MNNLQKLLRIQRDELISAFDKASIEGQGTPQEVSDRREKALQDFFKKYFPFPYQVTKGNISDSYGNRSQSIDTLIINPAHPHTVDRSDQYSFIVAEGVDYAIELKPELSGETEIERALTQIRSVKDLKRKTDGLLADRSKLSPAIKELILRIPCMIFSQKTYTDKEKLIEKIVSYYTKNRVSLDRQFDFFCCLDGTFIVNSSKALYFNLNTDGLVFADFGDDVLYYFFYFLCSIPQSTPLLKENMLKHYLRTPPNEGWNTFHDLNDDLRKIDERR